MNAHGKAVDTTYLSLETAEERGFIHRDYIAHCMRWSHVIKRLTERKQYTTARILDIGCGRELPLATTLYSSRLIPAAYYGVDVGPINDDAHARFHSGKFPLNVFERTDFCNLSLADLDGQLATHITCFEVLEHVEPKHMLRMLDHMKTLLQPNGTAFISTPCWDVMSCAANHVNEMKYEALGAVFEAGGWTVKNVSGTFASLRDYEHVLAPGHREAFNDLRDYYDVNFLACVFAPFYPAQSRNCLWEIQQGIGINTQFKPIEEVPVPWGSSALWKEMRR